VQEDKFHSIFASTTGFSFTVLAISTGMIKEIRSEMILPVIVGISATVLSLMIFKMEGLMGLWQRILFLVSFGWLFIEFKK
jgi:hypothetical protein